MTIARTVALGLALIVGVSTVSTAFAATTTTRGNPGPSNTNTSNTQSSTRDCNVLARCQPTQTIVPAKSSCKTWYDVEVNGRILRECRKYSNEG